MPAFNEADLIPNCIRETSEFLKGIGGERCAELIVVDDGSSDGTYQVARQAITPGEPVQVVRLARNSGKGFALKYGFVFATGDLVAFLDADLDLHPSQIATLYREMQKTNADVVIGSKRHPLSRLDYPRQRKILSSGYYLLVRALFGLPVRDTQAGLKLFKQEVLEQVFPRLLIKRFAFDLELLVNAHHLGYKIVEAPVTLSFQRRFGRIRWQDVLNISLDTLAVFYRLRILKYYDG
jgi:glycosyltransferase involved in cell wall biosynthesis